ncbi:MAG: PAS domain S-box protein, partial [Gemmatimonadetes bacterium]|nr:PAS domain S-box protein [Gemmatimonadota bacterium]
MTRPVSVRSSYSRHAAAFDAVAALALSTLALLAGWWAHAFARVGAVFRAAGELDQAVFAAIVLCVAAVMFGTRRWLEQRRAHAALGASEDEARSLLVRTAESAAELRERERRLRLVTDQLPAVVWTTSPDLVFTSAMGSGLRATGVDVHDCVGLPLAELLGADPENAALAAHRRSLEGEAVTYSLTFGGRTFAAHTEPLTDESGARIGVIGVALDETERTTAEAQYRRLVESSPYGIYVTDAQRRFVQANAAMSGILGRPVEALAGKGVEEVVAAADLETLRDVIARRESGESTPIGIEIHVVRPGGEQRRVHVTSTLVFDEQGALACTFGMVRDVTEERAAERRLAELSAALAAAVEGIARMDAEGRLVSANPAYAAAFGCAPHELAGTRCDGRVHPGDLPALREAYARMRREGRGELACRGVRADGTTFHLHTVLVAQHDESGAFTGHHSFLRDVTEKARADEALRFQAHLLQCVQQAVIATDAGGRITHWNRSAEALYGWRADEVLGRPVSEVVPAEGTGEAGEIPARMASGESWHGDFRVRRRDGSAFLAEVTGSPVHDAGRLAGAVCVSSDVTGRRRLEEQLRQVQKMEAVGQLAGGVAHDFNNLLTAINGYADLAAEEVPPGSAAREYAAEIRAAGGRAAGLTRQLLAFSRRQVLEPRLVELNAVAGGLEKMLRRVISEDVELVFRLDPGATPVFADPGQLDQVLLNLAVNARDAMPRGGRMVIETEAVELSQAAAETHPSGLPAGRYVALRVADDGEGMDA